MNLMRKASNGWILTCLIACVLLFTLTGIAWSSGAFAFTTALPFFVVSIVVATLIIRRADK